MKRGNRILIVALELAVLVLVVAGVHAWRTRDLLPAGDRTAAPAFEWPLLEGGVLDSTELTGRPAVLY
ncbi:MAG TPA: hypothetical protein VLT59_17140, partial [Steroidobacteraceae bacterium]|nr:hypothetical protein [Steroidobacteraceae bacterium]